MEEKIKSYQSELDKIQTVLDKLVTKQNSSVCDKLCIMCNSLFERIIDYKKEELTESHRSGLIEVLKRLREICIKLKNYQDYLIGVISENIDNLQTSGEKSVESSTPSVAKQLQYTNNSVPSVAPNITPINENQEKNAA